MPRAPAIAVSTVMMNFSTSRQEIGCVAIVGMKKNERIKCF
jgi:hypothetical protein